MFPSISIVRPLRFRILTAPLYAALTVVTLACTAGPRTPTAVGVIEGSQRRDSVTTVLLHDGSSLDLNFAESTMLESSSGGLEPGTLLLVGGGGDWYMTLGAVRIAPIGSREARDCYFIGSFGTRDDEHIVFDDGLRLPLSRGFRSGQRDGEPV